MAIDISPALAADMLNAAKTALDGGKLYYFAGPVPANANAALDLTVGTGQHTELAVISLNSTATGLTFATATAGQLNKTVAETWAGLVAFTGKDQALTTLTPTFWRFAPSGDNARTAGTGTTKRIQGTLGGPNSTADLILGADTLTRNGTNTESVTVFRLRALPVSA